MPQSCGAWKPPRYLTGYLSEEPGKQAVRSQKRGKRKLSSCGSKNHRYSGFCVSSPDPTIQVEEITLSNDFPTWALPHSFKPNLNSQARYSPSTPLICQDWFCRTGIREYLARNSPEEAAYGRGAATSPFIKHSGLGRKYLFAASTEKEASPYNISILTKINKFCWVGVLLIFFLTSCTIAKKLIQCHTFWWLSNE